MLRTVPWIALCYMLTSEGQPRQLFALGSWCCNTLVCAHVTLTLCIWDCWLALHFACVYQEIWRIAIKVMTHAKHAVASEETPEVLCNVAVGHGTKLMTYVFA